jgi:arsenate reductase
MAEALAKAKYADVFNAYSAGTETKAKINQDAVRILKDRYQIDMEQTQHSKLIDTLPKIDILVTMGCNVECPYLPCKHREDWGLNDPSGQADEVFHDTINLIEAKLNDLSIRIKNGLGQS